MQKKEIGFVFLTLSIITCIFFYKVIIFHQIPFPGDLLTTVAPYKTESYLGYSPSGYPNKAQGPDVIYEIYPWRYFSVKQLKHGAIPFWNPHNFSGNQQMQNFQTGLFYPLNIFYFLLPFTNAWTVIIISQPLLAGLFMYLFLRDLRNNSFASLIGAVAFAFSSYMTVWIEYANIGSAFLFLPLLLFLIRRFMRTEQLRYVLLLVLSLSTAFLAGYIQGVFYLYSVGFIYAGVLFFKGKKKVKIFSFFSVFLGFCVPILLTAFQLLPTIFLFTYSTRSTYSNAQLHQLLQPFYYWVTLFVPDFFGNPATRNMWVPLTYIERVMYPGVGILFFSLVGIVKSKHAEKPFFITLGGLVLLLTTNFPGVVSFYHIPIPMISTTVPTRAISLFIFSAIVLASLGIQEWIEDKKAGYPLVMAFLSIYILLWITTFGLQKIFPSLTGLSVTKHTLLLPTMLAFGIGACYLLRQKFPRMSYLGVAVFIGIDLFYFFMKITPFSPQSLIYPDTPVVRYLQNHAGINRFWGYGDAYIPPNIQSVDGTYSPEGNDPLHIKSYSILLASTKNGESPNPLPRPDANIASGYGSSDLRTNKYRQTVLNLLGVKYILHLNNGLSNVWVPDTQTFDPGNYTLIWQKSPWQIYENKTVLPRFFTVTDYTLITNPKQELVSLYHADLSKTIILEKNPLHHLDTNAKGRVILVTYSPNSVILKAQTTGNMLLFLSDTYYPDWVANIDGKPSEVYRADVAFRAVEIPSGKHTIVFSYNHINFTRGLFVAGIGIIILGVYSFLFRYYGKKS